MGQQIGIDQVRTLRNSLRVRQLQVVAELPNRSRRFTCEFYTAPVEYIWQILHPHHLLQDGVDSRSIGKRLSDQAFDNHFINGLIAFGIPHNCVSPVIGGQALCGQRVGQTGTPEVSKFPGSHVKSEAFLVARDVG